MKSLFTLLILFIGFSSSVFAQESIAKSNGDAALLKSKLSGVYEFTLPDNITQEDVDKKIKYYTYYMTADFNETTHKVTLTMNENASSNRYVIGRFLTACNVKEVDVDGKRLIMDEFVKSYLK